MREQNTMLVAKYRHADEGIDRWATLENRSYGAKIFEANWQCREFDLQYNNYDF